MRNTLKLSLLTGLLGLSLQINAAGTITGPGWYYQALPVGAVGTYANIFLKGAYADEATCQTIRWNDYDPSDGIKPWDGGPGCHYIYERDVANANDLYSVSFNPGSDTIIGLGADQLLQYFEEVKVINEEHNITQYKVKMNRLIDSYSNRQ